MTKHKTPKIIQQKLLCFEKVYYFMNDKRFHKRILIETNR